MNAIKRTVCWMVFVSPFLCSRSHSETTAPSTLEDARKIRDKVIEQVRTSGKAPGEFRATLAAPIFKLLGSENPEIRGIVFQTIPQLEGFRVRDALPFLEIASLPQTERARLLWLCLRTSSIELETNDKVDRFARAVLSDATCPPELICLIQAIAGPFEPVPTDAWIVKEHKEMFARRVLAALSRVGSEDCKLFPFYPSARDPAKRMRNAFEMVLRLGETFVGSAVADWYQVESDPNTRAVVLEKELFWDKAAEWQARRILVLQIAARDWDTTISKKAREMLDHEK